MLKELLALSILNIAFNSNYVGVDSIQYYQNNSEQKQFIFSFNSDYLSVHEVKVSIDLYDENDICKRSYHNSIEIIGKKNANANFYSDLTVSYALINATFGDYVLLEDARINFYSQNDCYIDNKNNVCDPIYLSEFSDNVTKDHYLNFIVKSDVFNRYLSTNIMNVNSIYFNSEYDFSDSLIYFKVNNHIEGYEVFYDNGYFIELDVDGSGIKYFVLKENYYVDLSEFYFSQEYKNNSVVINNIVFPYSEEQQVYHCQIIINTFINIYIDFDVITCGDLLGECSTSKFCLIRSNHD